MNKGVCKGGRDEEKLLREFLPSLLLEPVLVTTPGLLLSPSKKTDTC